MAWQLLLSLTLDLDIETEGAIMNAGAGEEVEKYGVRAPFTELRVSLRNLLISSPGHSSVPRIHCSYTS